LPTYFPGIEVHNRLDRDLYAAVGPLVTSCQVWNRCCIS
jgi:hypothetical protein